MEEIFEYLITLLNDNTDGLVYQGNYVFQFFTDSMSILDPVTGTLVNEEIEYSPVSLLSKLPVPFVENNKRVDWSVEFGIAIRIQGEAYDKTKDLDYANIKRVADLLQGKVYDSGNYRYTFKTQEQNYIGFSAIGNYNFALVTLAMTITQINYGYFGQEAKFYIDDQLLDVISAQIMPARGFYTTSDKTTLEADYNQPINKSIVIEIAFNYNGETGIIEEIMGTASITQAHTLKINFDSTDYSYPGYIESIPTDFTPGTLIRPKMRFVKGT